MYQSLKTATGNRLQATGDKEEEEEGRRDEGEKKNQDKRNKKQEWKIAR